jgi:hypothetical protein
MGVGVWALESVSRTRIRSPCSRLLGLLKPVRRSTDGTPMDGRESMDWYR